MIGTHHTITADLYNISSRIKEIDSDYFIVRNYKTQKYELHAKNKRGGSLCLVFPFDRLDYRTISCARRTRAERAAALLAEIEENNKKLQKQQAEAAAKKAVASFRG